MDLPLELRENKEPNASIYALATNPTGSVILCGTPGKSLEIYDPRSKKRVISLNGHTENIRSILVSNDGRWVICLFIHVSRLFLHLLIPLSSFGPWRNLNIVFLHIPIIPNLFGLFILIRLIWMSFGLEIRAAWLLKYAECRSERHQVHFQGVCPEVHLWFLSNKKKLWIVSLFVKTQSLFSRYIFSG
jgi:hypothetical protein